MLHLYLSLVRPHLDHVASVWCPYMKMDKTLPENVQKFAVRMATRSWDSSYQDLLELPTLELKLDSVSFTESYTTCAILIVLLLRIHFVAIIDFIPSFLKHSHPFAHTK